MEEAAARRQKTKRAEEPTLLEPRRSHAKSPRFEVAETDDVHPPSSPLTTKFDYSRWKVYGLLNGGLSYPLPHSVVDREAPLWDWNDMVYRYNSEDDTYMIFFTRTTPDMIAGKKELTDTSSVALDSAGKILYLEFRQASATFGCHLLEYPAPVEGWPPCILRWKYSEREGALDIYFIEESEVKSRFVRNQMAAKPFKYEIIFDCDKDGRFLGIEILSAPTLLAKRKKE